MCFLITVVLHHDDGTLVDTADPHQFTLRSLCGHVASVMPVFLDRSVSRSDRFFTVQKRRCADNGPTRKGNHILDTAQSLDTQ